MSLAVIPALRALGAPLSPSDVPRGAAQPAYNSKLKDSITERYGNVAVLPIKGSKGPAPAMAESGACGRCEAGAAGPQWGSPFRPRPATEMDIVDEALFYFRANVLFRSFEVKNDADRILVYVTLFTAKVSLAPLRLLPPPTAPLTTHACPIWTYY